MSTPISTLEGPASYEEDVKKSRFLALAWPVDDVGQAMAHFAAASDPEATHNCWAYRIGAQYRFNDDGEPGGTAGRPILQAIEGQGLDQVAVLVIRWFGGIKLGAGGLVRAYSGAAAQCLRLAPKRVIIPSRLVETAVVFAELARAQAFVLGQGAEIMAETYDGEGVSWLLKVPESALDAVHRGLIDMTRGKAPWKVQDAAGGAGEPA